MFSPIAAMVPVQKLIGDLDMQPKQNIFQETLRPQVEAKLYFGTSAAGAPNVYWDDFKSFLAESVTPHFPGFTVAEVIGYWKGEEERTRVLTILGDDTSALRTNCRTIAEHYKSRFNQEAVGISFTACAFAMETWPNGPVRLYHQLDKGTAAKIEAPIVRDEDGVPYVADGWMDAQQEEPGFDALCSH